MLSQLSPAIRQYLVVTGNYWAFTLTDGALRMLVVLHFHGLGYSPLEIALLFLFYEIFGVITNLVGGWLGAHLGLNRTMNFGLALQVVALAMLLVPHRQGPEQDECQKFYQATGACQCAGPALQVGGHPHRFKKCPQGRGVLPRRGAADVAGIYRCRRGDGCGPGAGLAGKYDLPEKRSRQGKQQTLALWVIGYGAVQAIAPRITGRNRESVPDGRSATRWAAGLAILPALIVLGLGTTEMSPALILIGGLLLFGALFAVNSSLHSYLIVSYAGSDGVSLDVGFYYMANAMGRLIGTVLSGWVFQLAGQGTTGLAACLWISGGMLVATVIISLGLPKRARPGPHGAEPQEPEHQEKIPQ